MLGARTRAHRVRQVQLCCNYAAKVVQNQFNAPETAVHPEIKPHFNFDVVAWR